MSRESILSQVSWAQAPSFNSEVEVKGNRVAKVAHRFNKAAVHTDRKKASKRGYVKHKGKDPSQAKEI